MKDKLKSLLMIIIGFAVTLVAVCLVVSLLDNNVTFTQAFKIPTTYILAIICAFTAYIVLSMLNGKK